ncbi:MAG: NAD-glutamate dehydrogenase [Rickettsiaceae bacterium]
MNKKTDHKELLPLSQLNCNINNFSAELLNLVNAEDNGSLYTKFVRRFLTYIPVDYRSIDKLKTFGNFTQEAFDFFKNRKPGQSKVEFISNGMQDNPTVTIFIATDNRPFLIDSLNNMVNTLPLQMIASIYPVINTVRDDKGLLKDIAEEGVEEVLGNIKVVGTLNDHSIKKITTAIHQIIELVNSTYDAWPVLLNKIVNITKHIENHTKLYKIANLPYEETTQFLHWLQNDNMTLLGAIDFDFETGKITKTNGIKEVWHDNSAEISTIIERSNSEYYKDKLIMLGKLNKVSPVHLNTLVDYILIKHLDKDGIYKTGTIIFGLYGTAIYFQSIHNVPILCGKMEHVLDRSEFPKNGYNAKKIKNIIESLPRDLLIQIDQEELYCICIHILSSMRSQKLKLFVQQDWSGAFINIMVFLPREALTPEVYNKLRRYLEKKFNSNIISDQITVVAHNFCHLFATITIKDRAKLDFCQEEMLQELVHITTNWSNSLLQAMCKKFGEYEGVIKHQQMIDAFPFEYKHKFDATVTIEDTHYLMQATNSNVLASNLIRSENNGFLLKLYSPSASLTLSKILPSIENLGFIAIDERSFEINASPLFEKSWLYEFKITSPIDIEIPYDTLKHNIEEAIEKINTSELVGSSLSKLIVLAGFNWQQVKILTALTSYLRQTNFAYGQLYVQQTLVTHYRYSSMLMDLFEALFCPKKKSKSKVDSLSVLLDNYLDGVDSSIEDKVLQNMRLLIKAIVRTNFYQLSATKQVKKYLSFKFNSTKIPDLPRPTPYAEIFVYSNEFEGIHLRGGKVARGGLRWSDRGEDYRTEALGLLKAQMTKNPVIVPVGSKGAFYVNTPQGTMNRDQYMLKVQACYQDFLRGLLDLTDNIVHGKIIHPDNTVMYDDADPYLVVAADKGTASFSDFANAISKEYNFWLGDAFASGGSLGYDHKKLGITAKGAWISVQSHFLDKGIDVQKQPFTVAGIGDMSGDVFGNGMLLSQHIKLVAAFNHQHIFIDPTPNPKTSYQERQRLFNLPRSKWSDYKTDLISTGGGVFDRASKTLTLTQEVKDLLDITVEQVTPDELISFILKSKVDLLWNGGIGTYVKSSVENNIDVGDKANDNLRVNGNDIRAMVIAEGGNLGMSQLGRIEYALKGGAINTDFIDNSAGVDCSDHEVNIKIALNLAMTKGKITLDERNILLAQMSKQVEELVLVDNYDQNLALTIAALSTTVNIESFSQLAKELEKKELLDGEVEFLPSQAELSRRAINNEGVTRPELAILLSYSKMALDLDLSGAKLTQDKYMNEYLLQYFPQTMREKFADEIHNHPLKQEIIRTMVTNKLVNQLGGSVISAIKRETGGHACDIARAYEVVTAIFNLQDLWQEVSDLNTNVSTKVKVEMFSDLSKIMRRGISWFVKNIKPPIIISDTIDEFMKQTEDLIAIISKLLVGTTKTRFFSQIDYYTTAGVDKKLAKRIATLEVLVSAFDIIYISKHTGAKSQDIANIYFECGDLLHIDWLRHSCEAQINDSYWNRLSIQSLKDDFYYKQRRLVKKIVSSNIAKTNIKSWLITNKKHASIFTDFIEDIKMQDSINLNMLILANKKLEIFLRKLKVIQ